MLSDKNEFLSYILGLDIDCGEKMNTEGTHCLNWWDKSTVRQFSYGLYTYSHIIFQMPLFANILGFNNFKKTLAAHKANCEVHLEGHVNTHSNPIPKAGPGSGLGLGLGPGDESIPNPRSQTSFSDVDFSITAIQNPNILFEFDSDSESKSDSRCRTIFSFVLKVTVGLMMMKILKTLKAWKIKR